MEKVFVALKSRTVWTLVFLFVLNGLNGLTGYVDEGALMFLNMALTALAGYFRLTPKSSN